MKYGLSFLTHFLALALSSHSVEDSKEPIHRMHQIEDVFKDIGVSTQVVLYNDTTEMDACVTYSPGFLKIVHSIEDVPILGTNCLGGYDRAHHCDLSNLLLSSSTGTFRSKNIRFGLGDFSVPTIIPEIWYHHTSQGSINVYGTEQSALFRFAINRYDAENFKTGIEKMQGRLKDGIYLVLPSENAYCVDWQEAPDTVRHLVKNQGHKRFLLTPGPHETMVKEIINKD